MESAFTPGVFNSFRQADLNCGDYMVRSMLVTFLGQFSCYSGNLRALGPDLEFRLLSLPKPEEVRAGMEPPVKPVRTIVIQCFLHRVFRSYFSVVRCRHATRPIGLAKGAKNVDEVSQKLFDHRGGSRVRLPSHPGDARADNLWFHRRDRTRREWWGGYPRGGHRHS
jgi:hypothetical protein